MTRSVRWSERAAADLEVIRQFLSLSSDATATTWIAKLMQAGDSLDDLSERDRRVPEWDAPDIRELVVRPYRLVYRLVDHEVVVLTVFDGHRLLPVEAMVEPGRQ